MLFSRKTSQAIRPAESPVKVHISTHGDGYRSVSIDGTTAQVRELMELTLNHPDMRVIPGIVIPADAVEVQW